MTTINVMSQPKNRAAYILADCAFTAPSGEVEEIGSKIIQSGSSFPWALGVSGNVHPKTLGRELLAVGVGSLKQLQRRLGPAMQRAIAATLVEHQGTKEVVCGVKGGAWDFARKRPIAFICMSHPDLYLAGQEAEPFVFYETQYGITAEEPSYLAELFGEVPDFTDPAAFNPEVDGLALMEAQRRLPMAPTTPGCDPEVRHRIGGEVDLVTITKRGVKIEGLWQWPDVVGKRINPHG